MAMGHSQTPSCGKTLKLKFVNITMAFDLQSFSLQRSIWLNSVHTKELCGTRDDLRRCILKFPDWPHEAKTANGKLSAYGCSCTAILWVSLVRFAAITLFDASQRVFIDVTSLRLSPENFWIQARMKAARLPTAHTINASFVKLVTHNDDISRHFGTTWKFN